ncbi:MAG: hypothetical protein EOP86_19810 [Verrucomicrobiaceae bacterium]|nr:MAG: hypothetical protein EOP86_19810 [Verrucomicrobiaceae bacterium]
MTFALITKFDGLVTALAFADSVKAPSQALKDAAKACRDKLELLLRNEAIIQGAIKEFDVILSDIEGLAGVRISLWNELVRLLPPLSTLKDDQQTVFDSAALPALKALAGEEAFYWPPKLLYGSSSSIWSTNYAEAGLGVVIP